MSTSTPSTQSTPAAMARQELQGGLRWRFAEVELDESSLTLKVAGQAVEIEPKPLELLMYLLRHAGEVATKDELLEALWPARVVTEASLTNCVAKLRQALADHEAVILRTVHGYGYRLGVPVSVETVAAPYASTLELQAGQTVPHRPNWKLREKLGAGGYGEAWLGEHGKTGERRVFKFCVQAGQLHALKREVTLSRLFAESLGQREDFVHVLDWNLSEPPYYLEAEYCALGSLNQWLHQQGGAARVPLETRLNCVAQAAETLAAAHALGVLHKDLKPSNLLMVEQAGGGVRIRIGDWGSGRVLDLERLRAANITQMGFTQAVTESGAGTTVYLAPEVLAGQPSTVQADIYALGVLLYQLVVGDDLGKTIAPGWQHGIADELLRADIEAAANGAPASRLASAHELADRLRQLPQRRQALLRERAAAAESAELQKAIERTRARRPWIIAAGSALVLGLATTLYFFQQSIVQRDEARNQTANAEAITQFLNDDVLGAADPFQSGSAKDMNVPQALDRAVARLGTEFPGRPALEGVIHLRVALMYSQRGDYATAETQNRLAVALLGKSRGANDPLTVQAQFRLAQAIFRQSRLEQGHQQLDIAERAWDASDHADLRTAQARDQAWLTIDNLEGKYDRSVGFAEQALAIDQQLAPYNVELASQFRTNLASVYTHLGRLHDADALLQQELDDYRRIGKAQSFASVFVQFRYGLNLRFEHRYAEAEPLLRDAADRMRTELGEHNVRAVEPLQDLALLELMTGRPAQALADEQIVLAAFRENYGAQHASSAVSQALVGMCEFESGQAGQGLGDLEQALASLAAHEGGDSAEAQYYRFFLAGDLLQAGRIAESRTLLAKLDAKPLQSYSPEGDWQPRLDALMGELAYAEGDKAQALKLLQPALAQMLRDQSYAAEISRAQRTLAQARS